MKQHYIVPYRACNATIAIIKWMYVGNQVMHLGRNLKNFKKIIL